MNYARRTCTSGYVCDCLDEPQFVEWYAVDCAIAGNTTSPPVADNMTWVPTVASKTLLPNEPRALFANVDPLSITVAFATAIAMFSLIALSVLFARFRKRNIKVQSLESGIEVANEEKAKAEACNLELKRSLAIAQKEVDAAVGDAYEVLKQYQIKHTELTFKDEIGHG